jgi:hypothetical protein
VHSRKGVFGHAWVGQARAGTTSARTTPPFILHTTVILHTTTHPCLFLYSFLQQWYEKALALPAKSEADKRMDTEMSTAVKKL